ncbi:MAG: Fe-S cluster assembly protein SufD [Chloroflexota bacterium]
MSDSSMRLRPIRGGSLASAPLTADLVEAFSAIRGEPSWLRDLRLRGWETFSTQALPTTRDEGWRRTNLSGLDIDTLLNPPALLAAALQLAACVERVLTPNEDVAGTLVIQDAAEVRCEIDPALVSQGVQVMCLDRAVRELPEQVQRALLSTRSKSPDLFAGIHQAYLSGGAFVFIPRGVLVEKPIQIVQAATEPGQSAFPHTLVVAEAGADVTILETYCSEDQTGEILVSAGVELLPADGARIQYINSQEWHPQAWYFGNMAAGAGRDSFVRWVLSSLGARLARVTLDAQLSAQGAETEIVGLVFGKNDQHVDQLTLQDHVASRTRSDQLFKAALRDTASSNFSGLIRVAEQADQTSSNMEARNLLLSGTAKADTDPRLEILNSDVERCAHGATVGPMDEDALFYVMSRGIARDEAQRLIVEAFFAPVLQRIPVDAVRERIWSAIQGELWTKHGDE